MSHEPIPNRIVSNFATKADVLPALGGVPTADFPGFLPPVSNTTYAPNQFFDVCLPHCSRSAIRVVGYFIRRTLGWCDQYGNPQEEKIEISFSELASKAGISRGRLRGVIDEAVAGHFLECVREGRANQPSMRGQSACYRLRWHDSAEYDKNPTTFGGFFEREGNRTDIPNQFFDHILPTESLSVIKVVGAVIRSSIGFEARRGARRQWATLSYTQIQNFTRLTSRKDLAAAIRTALSRRYIVRLEPGHFTHERAEQRSAVYALRWADGWAGNAHSLKSPPGETAPEWPQIPTRNGPTFPPEERPQIPTSFKTKLKNEMEKQQQEADSPAIEILRKEGFSVSVARELSEELSMDVIRRQLEWFSRRGPARSRLGMLRRAMEEDWPEPAQVRTSGLSSKNGPSDARNFVRHFYAGYHGNDGEPVSEASASEAAQAEPLVRRLQDAGAVEPDLHRWGRRLGRLAAAQRSPLPSFAVALRQLGDQLWADGQTDLAYQKILRPAQARREHESRCRPLYDDWLRREERKIRDTQQEQYAAFEASRLEARRKLSLRQDWVATLLERFDAEDTRLSHFQTYFRLPDYAAWQAEHHPYKPNSLS